MLLERIETPGLAAYSYIVACEGAGEAVVVDPRRDTDVYLRFVAERGLRITHVLETHIHADYASGARALAEAAGAPLLVSRFDAGQTYEVQHPHEDLDDGASIRVGKVRIEALHTPGHTPEHMCFALFDEARSAELPMALLTGDLLFVGSAGRPDLLGEETAAPLARELRRSLFERLASFPDFVEVHPAHGAGSMCGSGLAGRPVSTLGYERRTNPYFQERSEEEFVQWALANVPPFPPYYKRMKQLNAVGAEDATPLLVRTFTRALPPEQARAIVDGGGVVLDVRPPAEFCRGHAAGAISVGMGKSFTVWAAWAVPPGAPVVLMGSGADDVEQAARGLLRVGLDDVMGFVAGGFDAWERAGLPIEETPEVPPAQAWREAQEGRLALLDVRSDDEWRQGHAPGAAHRHAGLLAEQAAQVAAQLEGKPIGTICAAGYRATVAASLLKRAGATDVRVVEAGMNGWRAHDLPTDVDPRG